MFNTLASYLLGNSTAKSPTDTEPEQKNSTVADDQYIKFNLTTTSCDDDDDEDWLIVVRDESAGESGPQTDSEEEIPFVEIKNNPILRTRHSRNNSAAGSQDGAFSLLPTSLPSSMDESWYVTPPPCFTSTGPVNVETSPLENLLIEHPSMSVYHSIRSMQQSSEDDEDIEEQDGMVLVNVAAQAQPASPIHPASDRNSGHTARVARARSDHHVDHMTVQQVKQVVALKQSQKEKEKRNRQQMCRNAIERNNKVREVNCKGGRQKRSDMNHCKVLSRANNNRKC